jgi:3-hydroxyacyl-[acyl-carrier-protein] dehydratase
MLNDFYTILDQKGPEQEITPSGVTQKNWHFKLVLNPAHPVYGGHFPGSPVVPGVCQIQIIKELIEKIEGTALRLEHADNIKFLSLIQPGQNQVLTIDAGLRESAEKLSANVAIHEGEKTFLKFKGIFSKA